MTMLKPLAVAIFSAVTLVVIGDPASALNEQKQEMESKCKAWTTINQSDTATIVVARNGKDVELHCQDGFFAALQECDTEKKLQRFRCEQTRPKL